MTTIENTTNLQFYSKPNPSNNEIVLVKFIKHNMGFFNAVLLEYPGYTGIMNTTDATKLRRIPSWNKIVPLNKNMVACVEQVDSSNNNSKTVQLSIAYLNEGENKDLSPDEIQTKLMTYFYENKTLESFIKTICVMTKYSFEQIWVTLIHHIDTLRIQYNEMNEETISIWKYFCDNISDINTWFEEIDLDKSVSDAITTLYIKRTTKSDYKISTKFAIISLIGVNMIKTILDTIVSNMKFKYDLYYESTPNFRFESNSSDSKPDDHIQFIKLLEAEVEKTNKKVFIKVKQEDIAKKIE